MRRRTWFFYWLWVVKRRLRRLRRLRLLGCSLRLHRWMSGAGATGIALEDARAGGDCRVYFGPVDQCRDCGRLRPARYR